MNDQKKTHPLSALHIVAMVGLLAWWSVYFWHHTPARDILRARRPAPFAQHVARGDLGLETRATAELAEHTERIGDAVNAALADIADGLFVLILFAVGTGVYVRRVEIWLQARTSGDAMTLAGSGLGEKALAANADRGGAGR